MEPQRKSFINNVKDTAARGFLYYMVGALVVGITGGLFGIIPEKLMMWIILPALGPGIVICGIIAILGVLKEKAELKTKRNNTVFFCVLIFFGLFITWTMVKDLSFFRHF